MCCSINHSLHVDYTVLMTYLYFIIWPPSFILPTPASPQWQPPVCSLISMNFILCFKFHIYMKSMVFIFIWMFHLANELKVQPILSQMTRFQSLFWLSSIPLHMCTTFSLSIHWWTLRSFPYPCCSVTKSTLQDPMTCSMPGGSVLHCLLEFAQTHVHWVMNAISSSATHFSSWL